MVILPQMTLVSFPTLLTVRQRDTLIPSADVRHPDKSLSLATTLFDSVVSVLLAYGMKIALTFNGKLCSPHLENAAQGGFQ
jgi:hypothetical protein